jgi:hypothetical protein
MRYERVLFFTMISMLSSGCDALPSHTYQNVTPGQIIQEQQQVKLKGCFDLNQKSGYNTVGVQECTILENDSSGSKTEASLKGALLRGSIIGLSGGNIDLADADLRDTEFLPETTLNGANLSGANLSNARLGSASFENADFSNTCLIGVDMSHADLSNVNFKGAVFSSIPCTVELALQTGLVLMSDSSITSPCAEKVKNISQ